ncbi:uncharacterized protein LOC123396966 [Hordeum vulgare subsp. vulgare]|uniref:uncharacterized protein LOC123396966 n=1 Tax=Hordeum vulgare subsp. vulgare TaxID=112509 RepID=UPI001D1A582A|nr:uncharacterized protein LOC123396966 [Hordeum vulgare subsp. vulgare]
MASRCRWPPALARRLDPPLRRVSSEAAWGWGQDANLHDGDEDPRSASKGRRTTEIVIKEDEEEASDYEFSLGNVIEKSGHRDGSMYRAMRWGWKRNYPVGDRSETRLEAMRFSDSTERRSGCTMLQIFSLKLAKIPGNDGLVELYGYIAARDHVDKLLNYVINISRDDPIIVEQGHIHTYGSLISMGGGPKRGIDVADYALIEYDMRIKRGRQERDDLQLIDGASSLHYHGTWHRPFTYGISNDCGGAVDMTLACLCCAVETTVEVLISEVQSGFHMSLRCFTSGFNTEIRLFDGAVVGSCALKRSVVAVVEGSFMRLKFKVSTPSPGSESKRRCTFKAKTHGHNTREIKTDFALISVKVTWSTLPGRFPE